MEHIKKLESYTTIDYYMKGRLPRQTEIEQFVLKIQIEAREDKI